MKSSRAWTVSRSVAVFACSALATACGTNPAGNGPGSTNTGSSSTAAHASSTETSTSLATTNAPSQGSTSNGPSPSPSSAELVTSGVNAYWQTGAPLTMLSGGTTDLVVDPGTTYQRWDGFGGTFNEMGWDALSVVSSQIPTAIKMLFDPNDGLNFVYGRLPLGASDYAMSWYTCDDTANDYAMTNFSIARDQQMLIPYIEAALQIQPKLHLWASPWNPPSWMRDSSTMNMKSDAQTLTAYALYLARFVEEYAKIGLTIEAIHPQNEPGYAWAKWPGTLYIDFIKTYLGPMFAQRSVPAAIWCGTMSAPADGTLAQTLAADPVAMQYVKGFGVQWNVAPNVVGSLAQQRTVMQTEHRCGNYPASFQAPYWNQTYNPNQAQNDHAYGEASWQLIRDWIVAGVNSYSAWNMVLDTTGKSLTGWPQNALLVVDRTALTLTPTPAYYAFRHFSWVRPGATRIGLTGSTDALAFKNPDGKIVTEVYNSGGSDSTTTVAIGSATYQFAVPAHGWATLRVAP